MGNKALILVDIQNDFCPGGALAVPRGDEVIAVANRLQPHFDLVLATQDWHPANHKSFAANHDGRQPGDVIELAGLRQVLWPVHCVQNTPGAAFPQELDTERVAEVFRKGTDPEVDSYSCFYDNGRKHATGLTDYLRAREVSDVYLLGLATDYCVKASAIDARRDEFNAFVVEDGCRAVELADGDSDHAIHEMRQSGVAIVSSGQIGA